jgi:hypothetical protein
MQNVEIRHLDLSPRYRAHLLKGTSRSFIWRIGELRTVFGRDARPIRRVIVGHNLPFPTHPLTYLVLDVDVTRTSFEQRNTRLLPKCFSRHLINYDNERIFRKSTSNNSFPIYRKQSSTEKTPSVDL